MSWWKTAWLGHAAVPLLAAVGVQVAMGRLGPVGFGERAIPVEVLAVGLVVGSLYGLVGVGMVLVWRSHRLLNLAQAQLGAVPAVAALVLFGERGWPYLPAVALALVVAAGLGAASERFAIRRFDGAPRLAATIATLGLAQVLVAIEILVPRWLAGVDGIAQVPDSPFAGWRHPIGVVVFTGDHLAAAAVGVGLSVVVAIGLRRTRLGLTVRAVAARSVQAAQLGVPVGRIRAGVWAVAAVASALAVLLRAPLVGFPLGGLVGPGTLLFGLAAAALARFEHPVRALAGGMAVGVVEQGAVFGTGRSSAVDIAVLALIVVSLLMQKAVTGRLADVGAWLPAREVQPLPAQVAAAPAVRAARTIASTAVAVAVLALPLLLPVGQATRMAALCGFGVIAVAAVVVTGWSGQLGLGQVGVAGVGAAVAGGLVAGGGAASDLFVVLVLSAAAGAACSVLVGLPAVRSSGPQVAIVTLSFAFAVPALMLSPGLTGWLLPDGPVARPVLFGWIDLAPEHRFVYLALSVLVAALGLARRLRGSRAGRLLLAGRDDVRAVAAVGTAPVRARMFAFAVSGMLAGAAGAVIAWNQGVVKASAFAPQRSLDVVAAVVIGGISSPVGALAGVLWVFGLPMLFAGSPYVAALGSGVGVLVVLVAQPGGLAVLAGRWWRRVAVRLAGTDPSVMVRGGSAGRVAGVGPALVEAGRSPRPDRLIRRLELVARDGAAADPEPAAAVDAATPPIAAVTDGEQRRAVLEVEHLAVHRGNDVVLRDVSLRVGAGECVAVVGTNGAGKSTLLGAIAGGLRARHGVVRVAGTDVTAADPRAVAALGVAVHPGAGACFADLTVDEHFTVAARYLTGRPGVPAGDLYRLYPRLAERRDVVAGHSREASATSSPSPSPPCANPTCSSSTSCPSASLPTRSRSCAPRWPGSASAAARSSWSTSSSTTSPGSPTGRCSWSEGRSATTGLPTGCSRTRAGTARRSPRTRARRGRRLTAPPHGWRSTGCRCPTGRWRRWRRSPSASTRGPSSGSSAATAPARRRCSTPSPGTPSTTASSASTAPTWPGSVPRHVPVWGWAAASKPEPASTR